jgi:dihydrofolate reductase
MSLVTADFAVSLDLVGSGVDQSFEHPFGPKIGERLHAWFADEDNTPEREAIVGAGAYIMGRNMFGPDRDEWDLAWRGWWGDDPPYHAPVFVLCHREREPVEMEGGTTFHFVTGGIDAALERAREAAGDSWVSIAGGVRTTNAYLRAGLIDELRLHIAPITVGEGLRIFDGVGDMALEPVSARATGTCTHVTWRRPAS